MKKIHLLFLICFMLVGSIQFGYSQDLLKAKDLRDVKVDMLTNADIAKLKAQLTSAGMSVEVAEQMALSKGMPAIEVAKLKQRLFATPTTGNVNENADGLKEVTTNTPEPLDTYKDKKDKPLIDPLIFGSELYTGVAPSFEPNLQVATPFNYILGPGDQIQVSVYGVQEYNGELLVSPEGSVNVPNVGMIKITGLNIEAATQKMKGIMGNSVYKFLKTGEAKLSVTLSKIRSIKVTMIGSNRPGNFRVSSLSTVFNALYIAGGPSAFGSFREIELIRNNKLVRKIDLYRFIMKGDQTDNIGLQENDVIRIPSYKTRIELQGQFKRQGIFEVLPGESFSQVIMFASGFTDTAYKASVKIFQINEKERQVHDLTESQYDIYQPHSGDVVFASKVLDRFKNRITIDGSVFRPGMYELTPKLRLVDLINKADGLKEDAFKQRAQIIRLQGNSLRSIISVDINKALTGDTSNDILLQREDLITISSINDLRDSFKISIKGEIRMPGEYIYVQNLSLKDLILQAGGFTDAAFKNIEIARLVKRDSLSTNDKRSSTILFAEVSGDLSAPSTNIQLQPFDVVNVRKKAGYTIPESVSINGQIQFPGSYAIERTNEKVSDLIKRAGGFAMEAYPQGAYLKRYKSLAESGQTIETVKKLQKSIKDSSNNILNEVEKAYDQVPLNLVEIMNKPGSQQDLILKGKDELFIPKFVSQVKVRGEVLLTTLVPYRDKETFTDYIEKAGGFGAYAWRSRAYVVYANGAAATTKKFLFFKTYPRIEPGSEVVVPKKREKKGSSTGEIIGMASAIASLAGVVIAITKL